MTAPLYLIGSLRNSTIPSIAATLRGNGIEVFDSWYAAGPIADDSWMEYERGRGLTYKQALKDYAAKHVFEFDQYHLNRSKGGILVMPAGKSGHLELGYIMGQGKPGWVLFPDNPDTEEGFRWDVMNSFAEDIHFNIQELIDDIKYYFKFTKLSKTQMGELKNFERP